MKTFIITGDHPRHRFIASSVSAVSDLRSCFVEPRGPITPAAILDLPREILKVAKLHYQDREEVEAGYGMTSEVLLSRYFPIRRLENWEILRERLRADKPDVVISFGCSKIPEYLIKESGSLFINFHGGLSPWYKGTMTTFWPSFFLDPEKTGYTIHLTTSNIDSGDILARCATELDLSLTLNGLAKSATWALHKAIPSVFEVIERGVTQLDLTVQTSQGRTFRNSDWHPAHLVPIYKIQENKPLEYVTQFRKLVPYV